MSDLRQRLARLGLSQYLQVFTAEGFDTWETVLDITESDLSHLNVKLGHRRKLQRAIAETRGKSSDIPLPAALGRATSVEGSYRSGEESGPDSKGKQGEASATGASGQNAKRKYRRHPKPDEHAPERPPSAYVIFSNQIRELLRGQDLSFTEIAKVVGERWQILPAEEREACERQANGAKEKYYAELAEYKKTPQYEAYQKYLEEFKAKHAVPTKGAYHHFSPLPYNELNWSEGKRSKLETETSTSTRSSSHDQHERAANRRLSSVDHHAIGQQLSDVSPPIGPARLPAAPAFPPKATSPATQSMSTFNSPRTADPYSPISASPRSAMFDAATTGLPREPRGLPDGTYSYHPSPYAQSPYKPASTTPPSHIGAAHYSNPIELPSRRPMRESARLPPLTHEDTTWSSESGHSGSGFSNPPTGYPGTVLPLDPAKTLRILPQPVPSIGPSPSPLDRPPAFTPSSQPPSQDYRAQDPLAALVRAGELAAQVVDDEAMDVEGSP
ncbi:hypothetical protein FB567DRAFT_552804 [Paraphoma chrysanthemicola]|uniref:HMG box domain-containing protein n=1 Tax=Paraphoma chrysanthemicola TaxID=798071 RepID=A0A8K0VU47_9PLEO|nr:hypothetical protein FB567DRAFT_552804 [Paraphoma chrysanthemicola]